MGRRVHEQCRGDGKGLSIVEATRSERTEYPEAVKGTSPTSLPAVAA
jgi:hypothetical protein